MLMILNAILEIPEGVKYPLWLVVLYGVFRIIEKAIPAVSEFLSIKKCEADCAQLRTELEAMKVKVEAKDIKLLDANSKLQNILGKLSILHRLHPELGLTDAE